MEAAQARQSLRRSKCHIVGNPMPRLIYSFFLIWFNDLALSVLVQDMLPDVQPHKPLYNGTVSIRLGQTGYLGIISMSLC